MNKNNVLCVKFLYRKNQTLSVTFLFSKNPDTLRHIFILKNTSLCLTFIYILLSIVCYDNSLLKYDQSDQIDK